MQNHLHVLPLDDLFALPKATRGATEVLQTEHNRRLCTLVRRLDTITLGHVGVDVARTAGVDQDASVLLVLFSGESLCEGSGTGFAHSICSRRPSKLFLFALLNGLCEVLHERGTVIDAGLGSRDESVTQLGSVFVELACHRGDVDQTAAVANQRQDELSGLEGAIVVCVQRLLDDIGVKAIHGDAGVVDQNINAVWVLFAQKVAEGMDAGLVADVELAEGDGCVASILGQDLCLLELGIIGQLLDSGSAS